MNWRCVKTDGRANVTYHRPLLLEEALDVAADGAVIAAGCTDLFPATEAQSLEPRDGRPVLDLTAINGLKGVARTPDGVTIGALATWSDVWRAPLPPAFDGLKAAARDVGSIQIQNSGTVGGNLVNASPAADGVPPLLTLDASVELTSKAGQRRLLLQEFLVGPRQTALEQGEILTAVTVPSAAVDGFGAFLKLGARKHLVISIAMAAVRLCAAHGVVTRAAIAVGACGPVASRLVDAEAALSGAPFDADLPDRVSDAMVAGALSPIDDVRGDAAYRLDAAATLVRRAVAQLAPAP